jgi:hypothetical protein
MSGYDRCGRSHADEQMPAGNRRPAPARVADDSTLCNPVALEEPGRGSGWGGRLRSGEGRGGARSGNPEGTPPEFRVARSGTRLARRPLKYPNTPRRQVYKGKHESLLPVCRPATLSPSPVAATGQAGRNPLGA